MSQRRSRRRRGASGSTVPGFASSWRTSSRALAITSGRARRRPASQPASRAAHVVSSVSAAEGDHPTSWSAGRSSGRQPFPVRRPASRPSSGRSPMLLSGPASVLTTAAVRSPLKPAARSRNEPTSCRPARTSAHSSASRRDALGGLQHLDVLRQAAQHLRRVDRPVVAAGARIRHDPRRTRVERDRGRRCATRPRTSPCRRAS